MKICAAALAITLLAGCGSGSKSPSGSAASQAIAISGFKYAPATVTVKAGAKVTWTNEDSAPHTATLPGTFDTGTLQKGGSKTLVLDKPGTYTYVCQFHPFMKGKITVE